MDDDLCFTPAVELARRLHARELSARELLDAYLDRIGRVNPALNAIVTLAEEQAARRSGRCTACRSRSRTSPTPRASGRHTVPRCSRIMCRTPTPRTSRRCGRPAR
jgi:Asp-tRNA(Asn)/Glu-tRNA(Gln) amidotransferase A subunit family amidase